MAFNLTLSPPQLEIFIAPGTSFTQAYNITNNDTSPITLTSSVDSWQAIGNDGSVQYLPSENLVDFSLLNADLRLNQSFTINPGATRQLVLKVTAKTGVRGDSYHTLFLSQINTLNNLDTAAITSGKIGSHILISISPTENINYQAKINNFSVSPIIKDIFYSDISVSAIVENQSDYYFKTIGELTIIKNNREFKKFTLAPLNVAAHNSRQILCLDNSLSLKTPTAQNCTLSSPFWPGVYKATLTFDDSLRTPPVTRSFFVFPYYFTLAAVLIAILVVAYLKIQSHHKQ